MVLEVGENRWFKIRPEEKEFAVNFWENIMKNN